MLNMRKVIFKLNKPLQWWWSRGGHICLCDSDIKAKKSITEGHGPEGEANTCKQYVIKRIYFMLIWIDYLC